MPLERRLRALLFTVVASIIFIVFTDMLFLPRNLFTSVADDLKNAKRTTLKQVQMESKIQNPKPSNKAQRVLILSSVGRSGSSFLGDILASQGNNVYFYEPIRYLGSENWRNKTLVIKTLKNTFECEYSEKIFNTSKKASATFRHPYTLHYRNVSQISLNRARHLCHQSSLIIIKTIRTRLEWSQELLEDPSLNLYVIHLVRDPRGSLYSMENYVKWRKEETEVCGYIKQDISYKKYIEMQFPKRYLLVRYEDICQNTWEKISEIFKFLNKDNNNISKESFVLPKGIVRYLNQHVHPPPPLLRRLGKGRNPYNLHRDTSSVYQRWRWLMGQQQLSRIESICRDVLATLQYTLFSTVQNARNKSISIFS